MFSVTGTVKLPSGCTTPLPIAVVPSRMVTVAPASAASTVPVMVWFVWLVGPPLLVIATTGGAAVVKISRGALVVDGGVCTGAGAVEAELLGLFTIVVISGLESAASWVFVLLVSGSTEVEGATVGKTELPANFVVDCGVTSPRLPSEGGGVFGAIAL